MFVPGKPFQPSLMFVGKVRSLPYIRLSWKGLQGTNTSLLQNFVNYGQTLTSLLFKLISSSMMPRKYKP
jgi:hypothetical protein